MPTWLIVVIAWFVIAFVAMADEYLPDRITDRVKGWAKQADRVLGFFGYLLVVAFALYCIFGNPEQDTGSDGHPLAWNLIGFSILVAIGARWTFIHRDRYDDMWRWLAGGAVLLLIFGLTNPWVPSP